MSQEAKVEESGILSEEEEEGNDKDLMSEDNQSVKLEMKSEYQSNEEQKLEQTDNNESRQNDEQSQAQTSSSIKNISKQNEDSDDFNFHEESYHKESILQNEDHVQENNQENQITVEDKDDNHKVFCKEQQQDRELTNIIIEASSNSSYKAHFFISQTDEIKSKKTQSQEQQEEYEMCENTKKSESSEQKQDGKYQGTLKKKSTEKIVICSDHDDLEEEKTISNVGEMQGQMQSSRTEYVYDEKKGKSIDQIQDNVDIQNEQNDQKYETSKEIDVSNNINQLQPQVVHQEGYGQHTSYSIDNQAFEQQSPAQNTEIVQKNQRKESIMVDHQVEDSMFHVENKMAGNTGDGKSSSASDNGDEIIQGYLNDPLNQIPQQLKMIRNKSNDSEDPYGKTVGNFFVSQMYQFQQLQNENAAVSSGGGVVLIGGNNSENYSYSSPEVIAHQQQKSQSPDIMEINFSSSNQTNSFGFSKLSLEKISNQNDNNQNNNNNNTNNNNNNKGMISVDSKQYSGSNSYELNYSIKIMHNSNDPISIDDSKRNIKQFQNDERVMHEDNDDDYEQEEKGDIILQQDPTTEFSKHLFQARVEKIDTIQQIKGKTQKLLQGGKEQNKKGQKNDYFIIQSDNNNEENPSQEYQIIEKEGERRMSQENPQEDLQSKNIQISTDQKENQNQKHIFGKVEAENQKDVFADFFSKPMTFKQGEQESSQFMTNSDMNTQQFPLSNRNEEAQLYQNFQSNESPQIQNKNKKFNVIKINPNQLRDDSTYSDTSKEECKQSGKQYLQQIKQKKGQNIQQPKVLQQNDQLIQQGKQQNNKGQSITGADNPLSLSDLNSFSSRIQNNSLINSSKALRNVNIIHKIVIIFNCILYGYLIPQYPQFIGKDTQTIISVYLFSSAVISFTLKRQFLPDLTVFYEIGLGIANVLLNNPNYNFIINILFFGQFLLSIWKLNAISTRIRSITDVLNSSFRPNIEILGFLIILILLFNVIFNVFRLTNTKGGIFSFSAFEYFKFYVTSVFLRNSEYELIPKSENVNLSEPMIYFSFACAFICLFFTKIVVENLLSIVQKVSQEQYYEYVGPYYSCGRLAIFKENEKMISLYDSKMLYSLMQGMFMMLFITIQCLANESIDNNQKNISIITVAAFLRYGSLIFILYEMSIDVAMSSAISICKNTLYILIMCNPSYYRLFAIALFYGICSHIAYFRVLTNHIATLLLDFALIVFINYIIYLSYINCDLSRSISSVIPMFIMFFVTSPFLKGMMLRYSEIFEVEEDEETILSSLNAGQDKNQITDEIYNEFYDDDDGDDEIEFKGDIILDTESSTNQGIKQNLQSNSLVKKYSNMKSFFLFSRKNTFRSMCIKIINSSLFYQVQSLLMLMIGMKEFFYFLCSAFSVSYHNEFIVIISYWEKFVEPTLLGFIILINSISYGFLFNKNSYLSQSLRNVLFFSLYIIIYGLQQFIKKTYFGFLRVIFLIYLLPFGIKKLNDIYSAISHSKRIILQIVFLFSSIFLIHEMYVSPSIKNKSDYILAYINQLIYLFSINIFVGAILVEFSKQQLIYQNPNMIWTSIKRKIANHKFNFYFIKSKNTSSQTSILSRFLKSQYHNLIISILTGLYYLSLFLIGLVEDYFSSNEELYYFVSKTYLKNTLISGFTYFIILYSIIHISVYNLAPFFCSSPLNKALFFQSFILLIVLVIDIFTDMMSEYSLKIQFILQLPMLLRTKYMFPIVKFSKCIFRQAIVTQVVSLVMIVCIAHFIKDSRTSVVEYLLVIFNITPNQFIIDSSEGWKNIVFILMIYLSNGLCNSILLLDIIRKFDLNESAQAKNKFKQILSIFENIWDKYKVSHNPSLMKVSNLVYFLVKFDKAIEEEELLKEDRNKQKPLKITYLKRISKMRIKINEDQCLYYKDLLFQLISNKFNRIQDEDNYCYGSMSSFNNMNQSAFYNQTAEDLELSQLSSRRRWKVYNPIKQKLYASLAFSTLKKFSETVMLAEDKDVEIDDEEDDQTNRNQVEDEEDSIFFDPNMVPPETIQQQSLSSRLETN